MKTKPASEQWQDIVDECLENVIVALGQCQKGTARQFIRSAIERSHAAQPQRSDSRCNISGFGSGICNLGTKGCDVYHDTAETPTQRGEHMPKLCPLHRANYDADTRDMPRR